MIVDATESKRPKINAHQKPSILIPETNLSANRIIKTFITKRKSPRVIMVRGKVNIMSSGFTIALSIASTNAKIIAVLNKSMAMCGFNSIDNTYTTTAVISKLMIHLIVNNLNRKLL
jgi:hypothetical protein